jgi:hypothetical protein
MLQRLTVVAAFTVALGACGSNDPQTNERDPGVYAAAIEAVATEPLGRIASGDDDQLVVYAVAADEDNGISLDVQAAVAEQLEDVITVRFVDKRSEAVDDSEPSEPVLEEGVLVVLGRVPSGPSPSVDTERYVDRNHIDRMRVDLQRTGDDWKVTAVEPLD